MRSEVADEVRRSQRERLERMTPGARIRLALELGERDLRMFASARGISLAEALRELRRAKAAGRATSADDDGP